MKASGLAAIQCGKALWLWWERVRALARDGDLPHEFLSVDSVSPKAMPAHGLSHLPRRPLWPCQTDGSSGFETRKLSMIQGFTHSGSQPRPQAAGPSRCGKLVAICATVTVRHCPAMFPEVVKVECLPTSQARPPSTAVYMDTYRFVPKETSQAPCLVPLFHMGKVSMGS